MKPSTIFTCCVFIHLFLLFPVLTKGNDSLPKPTNNPINDTILFFEDFNDGDFTSNPAWIPIVEQACASGFSQVSVVEGVLRLYQANSDKCGTQAKIIIELNIPVSDSTTIRFDVKPAFSNVTGGAGYVGVEYPVIISISIKTCFDEACILSFCYNYRGGDTKISKDYMYIVFPDCKQGEWKRNETFMIRNFFPEAAKITKLEIFAVGWNYEGYADNIVIYDLLAPAIKQTKMQIDSLETILSLAPENEKVAILMLLSDHYQYISLSKSIVYAKEAYDLSLKNGNKQIEKKARERLSIEPPQKDNSQKAVEMYKKRLEVNLRMGKKLSELYLLYINIGESFFEMNQYDSALFYLHRMTDIIQGNKDVCPRIIPAFSIMSRIFQYRKDYINAIHTLDTLIQICESTRNLNGKSEALYQKARIYLISEKADEAEMYFHELAEHSGKTGNSEFVAMAYDYLGDIYY